MELLPLELSVPADLPRDGYKDWGNNAAPRMWVAMADPNPGAPLLRLAKDSLESNLGQADKDDYGSWALARLTEATSDLSEGSPASVELSSGMLRRVSAAVLSLSYSDGLNCVVVPEKPDESKLLIAGLNAAISPYRSDEEARGIFETFADADRNRSFDDTVITFRSTLGQVRFR